MEAQEASNSQNNLRKNNPGGTTLPDMKVYYKATLIKTVEWWNKNKYLDQWNKTDSRNESTLLRVINLIKVARITMRKRQAQQVVLRKVDSYVKKIKQVYFLTPCTQINSKWIKDLNGRLKSTKLLEEK